MKTKTYIVKNPAGANLRTLPSTSAGAVAAFLPAGAVVNVITDFSAVNIVGESTEYLCVMYNARYLWCASALLREHISYLALAEEAAQKVYGTIYSQGTRHGSGAKSLADIVAKRVTSCTSAASAVLQEAGCLPVGKTVSHTAAVSSDILSKKDTLDKAVKGAENLIEGTCTVVRVGKKFFDLPEAYKKAGTVYVQDSNICVSAGNGRIWSCNQTGKSYGTGACEVLRTSGYPFTSPILYVIQPNP